MTSSDFRPTSRAFLLPLVLLIAAIVFRWAKLEGFVTHGVLENFNPWMALAFTGTLLFSKRVSFLLIPLLLVVIDAVTAGATSVLHGEKLAVYACFAIAALLASRMRGQMSLLGSLVGVLGCSLVFYLITNTIAWVGSPVYAKNFAGWMQAITTGDPAYSPTWWFLRNSLVSDLGFSLLLIAAYNTEAVCRRQQLIPLSQPLAA